MTLDRWRKKFPEFPKPRANGRWDVQAVRQFMDDHNLADEPPEETVSDGEPSRAHWDRLKAKTDYERAQFLLGVEQKKFVELNEACMAVGKLLSGFTLACRMFPASAARWLVGLRDFHSIRSKLESEIIALRQTLGSGKVLLEFEPCDSCAKAMIKIGKESLKELGMDIEGGTGVEAE